MCSLPKVPKITSELWDAFHLLLNAKEEEKRTRDHVLPKLDAMAKEFSFPNHFLIENKDNLSDRAFDSEKKIITTADDMYMASDENAKKFFDASDVLYEKLGYEIEKGFCPILRSNSNTMKAEDDFIHKSLYLVDGMEQQKERILRNLEYRRKYLELTIGLLESFKDSEDKLLILQKNVNN